MRFRQEDHEEDVANRTDTTRKSGGFGCERERGGSRGEDEEEVERLRYRET